MHEYKSQLTRRYIRERLTRQRWRMLILRGPLGRVTLILRFPAGQFAQLQIDALAKLLSMPDQLAIRLVHYLHQQIVVRRVGYAGLRGRGNRVRCLLAVSAVLLSFRQRADQVEVCISLTPVLQGRAPVVPSRRVARHRVDTPISSHRVEIPMATSY